MLTHTTHYLVSKKTCPALIYECPQLSSDRIIRVVVARAYNYLQFLDKKYPLYYVAMDGSEILPYFTWLKRAIASSKLRTQDMQFFDYSKSPEPYLLLLYHILVGYEHMFHILPGSKIGEFTVDYWTAPTLSFYRNKDPLKAQFLVTQPIDCIQFISYFCYAAYTYSGAAKNGYYDSLSYDMDLYDYTTGEALGIDLAQLQKNKLNADTPVHLRYETYFP